MGLTMTDKNRLLSFLVSFIFFSCAPATVSHPGPRSGGSSGVVSLQGLPQDPPEGLNDEGPEGPHLTGTGLVPPHVCGSIKPVRTGGARGKSSAELAQPSGQMAGVDGPFGSDSHRPSEHWTLLIQGKEILLRDCVFVQRNGWMVLQEGTIVLKDGRVISIQESGAASEDEQLVLIDGRLVPLQSSLVQRARLTGSGLGLRSQSDGRVFLQDCRVILQNCCFLEGDQRLQLPDGLLSPSLNQAEVRDGVFALDFRHLASLKDATFQTRFPKAFMAALFPGGAFQMPLTAGRDDVVLEERRSSDGNQEDFDGDSSDEEIAYFVVDEAAFARDQASRVRVIRKVPPEYTALDHESLRFAFGRLGFRGKQVLEFADWILEQSEPRQTLRTYDRAFAYAYEIKLRLSMTKAREFAELFAQRSPKAFFIYKRAYENAIAGDFEKNRAPMGRVQARSFAEKHVAKWEARKIGISQSH